jgi:hypothetical protein
MTMFPIVIRIAAGTKRTAALVFVPILAGSDRSQTLLEFAAAPFDFQPLAPFEILRRNESIWPTLAQQPGRWAMPNAAEFRELASRLLAFALAMNTNDENVFEWLCVRAGEYLDQAAALEAATTSAEPVTQQAQQPQPDKED